jgi:hypothetical protein
MKEVMLDLVVDIDDLVQNHPEEHRELVRRAMSDDGILGKAFETYVEILRTDLKGREKIQES